jgi:hypothetical protein
MMQWSIICLSHNQNDKVIGFIPDYTNICRQSQGSAQDYWSGGCFFYNVIWANNAIFHYFMVKINIF